MASPIFPALALTAAGGMGVLLRLCPPDRYPIYPPCPFHALTGLLCPGCGMTRALAALVQGNLAEALRLNWLGTGLLPLVVALCAVQLLHPETVSSRRLTQLGILIVAASTVFTIARNLP